ncbi:MAG: helix-turn-helix domain-containing protein [Candidatus Acidiferrales bacterium]
MKTRYQEFKPSPRFSSHIECFWCHRTADREPAHRVLPDGCMDIIFEKSPNKVGAAALRIVGAMTRAQSFVIPPQHVTFGVRFHPAMAARMLRVAGKEIVDGILTLEDVWGAAVARRLHEQLEECTSPVEFIAQLENALGEPPAPDPIEKSVAWLVQSRGQVPVEELADAASLSPRQFRRVCFERAGLTPKHLARILRFHNAAMHAVAPRRNDWAQLALDCGYYDQAHFINEFREFTGVAPVEFASASPPSA